MLFYLLLHAQVFKISHKDSLIPINCMKNFCKKIRSIGKQAFQHWTKAFAIVFQVVNILKWVLLITS